MFLNKKLFVFQFCNVVGGSKGQRYKDTKVFCHELHEFPQILIVDFSQNARNTARGFNHGNAIYNYVKSVTFPVVETTGYV
ncbi:hypothetical protein DBB36_21940 [Flavobacterium sp. WLB]|nr:hypothetical protein AKO67_06240 [Flavobacterium sp. VMW]OWU89196.1 hypothetical protein APR43_18515 [Flavobacterium sp. NLM]PUU67831.1 hypothetical protein DBB36_21940 [Flavobacterium sp. WLB]